MKPVNDDFPSNKQILALWHSTKESKHWGAVGYIYKINRCPGLVTLHASHRDGDEIYAIMAVADGASVLPPLLASGGFIPLADGRVREDVPFDNYVYYRRLLEEIVKT